MNPRKWPIYFFAAALTVCAAHAQQPADQSSPRATQKSQKPQSAAGRKKESTPKPIPISSSESVADPALDSVLSKMDAAATDFRSAEADLTQQDYQKVVDDLHTENGKIYFHRTGKGLQMAMDFMSSPESKYVVLNDNKIRLYQPRIDQVTEYTIGKDRAEVESMFALGFGGRGHDLLKSFEVRLTGTETIDEVKVARLELTPKTEGLKKYFSSIELWVDPSRNVSLQQKFWQPSGDYHQAHYSRIKLNQKIAEDVFKLKTTSHTRTVRP
jgi:outer membrane lipoprotein-sorting protein